MSCYFGLLGFPGRAHFGPNESPTVPQPLLQAPRASLRRLAWRPWPPAESMRTAKSELSIPDAGSVHYTTLRYVASRYFTLRYVTLGFVPLAYTCVYTHTYICIRIHIYVYTYMYIYIYTYTHLDTYIDTYMNINKH